MANLDPKRVANLEADLGHKLPANLIAALTQPKWPANVRLAIAAPNRIWRVGTLFVLDKGKDFNQLDNLYHLVGDAVPRGTIPFAADPFDDFYLLVLQGKQAGKVVSWSHERDEDDDSVSKSLEDFYARLVPFTKEMEEE